MKYPIQRLKLRKKRERRKRKPIPRIVIPSFFTLMNLFCGFLSIIMVAEGNLVFGAWLIVVSGLFDALDGFMARLANATSEFGIELDSISDVVSFGVAPGFLLYTFTLHELDIIGIILSALPHGFLSFIIPVVIVLSFLMVSTIPFDKIPRFDKTSVKKYKNRLILFFIYMLIIAIFQDIGLMIVFTFFILKGLVIGAIIFWKRAFTDDDEPLEIPV